MTALLVVLTVMGVSLGVIFGYPVWKNWRRRRLRASPFPAQWLATVRATIPFYDQIPADLQGQIQESIQVLLAEKQFIGCNGLVVTLEMKIQILAIAALLLFSQNHRYFPQLKTILLYPTAYRVRHRLPVGGGMVEERQEVRLGESWSRDQLVLAWDQVQRDLGQWQDGRNVVLHEFAHQLDQAEGPTEGVPRLAQSEAYSAWATVMTRAYRQLCADVQRGRPTVLDPYGASSPAEFFAVATEAFFEKPQQLFRQQRDLYHLLRTYYGLDRLA
ncbi:M90 family metallopeptidase [Lyngbya confervoides]|uniref:Zinc-dependent peptidase n=1 Tax=Lyngbya confervoides BDU141951 TaxID=1574623 RepID=A0ABD4SZW2_9CYAN|nr:M90 family metallopeptidase [Lyngbya confervoides]MCM1981862.1 zinc-dependent peptidase [Lyngbya confervoides BDU141951]